jgi:hypothetical protein
MIVNLKNKTGFSSSGGAVMVTHAGGKLFYQVERKGPFSFNLPKGQYVIKGNVKMLSKPIEYKIKANRVQESNHTLPKRGELQIEFGDNPNKASIWVKKHKILIDNRYKDAPEVVKAYLIAHEIGHYRYKTERFADEFAQQVLLDKGYPMTLIVQAAASTLYNGHERHSYCYENMKNAIKR